MFSDRIYTKYTKANTKELDSHRISHQQSKAIALAHLFTDIFLSRMRQAAYSNDDSILDTTVTSAMLK